MALLGICGVHDIHEINALKVVTAVVSIGFHPSTSYSRVGCKVVFASRWRSLPASVSYFGAHYSRKINRRAMRWTVAIIGFVTARYSSWRTIYDGWHGRGFERTDF